MVIAIYRHNSYIFIAPCGRDLGRVSMCCPKPNLSAFISRTKTFVLLGPNKTNVLVRDMKALSQMVSRMCFYGMFHAAAVAAAL